MENAKIMVKHVQMNELGDAGRYKKETESPRKCHRQLSHVLYGTSIKDDKMDYGGVNCYLRKSK